jgi:hypothetical protein
MRTCSSGCLGKDNWLPGNWPRRKTLKNLVGPLKIYSEHSIVSSTNNLKRRNQLFRGAGGVDCMFSMHKVLGSILSINK